LHQKDGNNGNIYDASVEPIACQPSDLCNHGAYSTHAVGANIRSASDVHCDFNASPGVPLNPERIHIENSLIAVVSQASALGCGPFEAWVQAYDHRIVIRCAKGCGSRQIGQLSVGFIRCFVVQHARFVTIDVPLGRPGHLGGEAGIRQGVIQITGLSLEYVRVTVRP
jgi:hypothetical protein